MFSPEVQLLIDGFKAQGIEAVYVSECCNRVYVGVKPPGSCRTCEKKPEAERVQLT